MNKWCVGLGLGVFGVFLFTAHPGVAPYRDSGDLTVAAATLGIAHPPGYPVYVAAGKIAATLIPWGNSGYRLNAASALYGAAAVGVAALLVAALFPGSGWALFGVVFFAFSPAFWRLSQVSEMYSLNALFAALLFYAAHGLRASPARAVYFISFVCGLAFGNHQTVLLVMPGIAWIIVGTRFSARHYFYALSFFLLGASVYLFLPLRSLAHPLLEWGEPKSLRNLLRIITRADYGGLRLHPEQSTFSWTPASVFAHLGVYARSLTDQFTPAGVALGLWGIFRVRGQRFFQALFIALIFSGLFFVILSNLPPGERTTLPILEPHLVLPGLVFLFFIAAGAASVAVRAPVKILVAALALGAGAAHLGDASYRFHFYACDYGRHLLSTAGPGAFLYNPDDPTAFITTYRTVIGNRRPDVKLIAYFRTRWGYERIKKRYPGILPEREITSGQELERVILDYNRGRFPIYAELPGKFPAGYQSYPHGLLYRLSRSGEDEPSGLPFEFYGARNTMRTSRRYDFFTNQVISYYAVSRTNLGLALAHRGDYEGAHFQYTAALAIDPQLDAALNNLGILEYVSGNYDEAARWFKAVLSNDENNALACHNLGLVYKAQKKFVFAEESFNAAWRQGQYADAGNELGLIALSRAEYARALDYFNAILRRRPDYALAYYNGGLALEKLGRIEESRGYYEQYMKRVSDPRERREAERILRRLSGI